MKLTALQKMQIVKPRDRRWLTRVQAEVYMNLRDSGVPFKTAERMALKG